jgi:hypothetical protein
VIRKYEFASRDIGIRSTPGRGAIVEVFLPRAIARGSAGHLATISSEVPSETRLATIMIVDDQVVVTGYVDEPEFAAAYTRVRAAVVEDWVDDMIDITDREDLDPLDKRVRIDARRWIMSKVAPVRYGDKIIVGGDGSFGGLRGGWVSLSDLSDEQLAAWKA